MEFATDDQAGAGPVREGYVEHGCGIGRVPVDGLAERCQIRVVLAEDGAIEMLAHDVCGRSPVPFPEPPQM